MSTKTRAKTTTKMRLDSKKVSIPFHCHLFTLFNLLLSWTKQQLLKDIVKSIAAIGYTTCNYYCRINFGFN